MKKLACFFATVLALAPINSAFAEAISDEQRGLISTNCASIKLQLEKVQKDDPKNRAHLGAQYETILTNLMMNLNLRLVKNNRADASLAEQQTKFTNQRDRFKDDYVKYSRELDELVDINCKEHPQTFYDKLTSVREKRKIVSKDILELNATLEEHYATVINFRKGLTRWIITKKNQSVAAAISLF